MPKTRKRHLPSLHLRNSTWYVRKPVPADLQPALGRKEIWVSLKTKDRRLAEGRLHAEQVRLQDQFDAERRKLNAAQEEREYLASPRFDQHADELHRMRSAMHLPSAGYAPRIMSRADAEYVELALLAGIVFPRPRSRAEVVKDVDEALAQLDYEREYETSLIVGVDHEGEPELAVPWRYADRVRTYLLGLMEADRLSLEAKRAEFAGTNGAQPEEVGAQLESSLEALQQRWQAERKPA